MLTLLCYFQGPTLLTFCRVGFLFSHGQYYEIYLVFLSDQTVIKITIVSHIFSVSGTTIPIFGIRKKVLANFWEKSWLLLLAHSAYFWQNVRFTIFAIHVFIFNKKYPSKTFFPKNRDAQLTLDQQISIFYFLTFKVSKILVFLAPNF